IQTPGAVGYGLNELDLDDALGLEIIHEAFEEARISIEVGFGGHDRLATEGVAHGIEARNLFTGGSARAGRGARGYTMDLGAGFGELGSIAHSGLSMGLGVA